jgi:hypothetical protein
MIKPQADTGGSDVQHSDTPSPTNTPPPTTPTTAPRSKRKIAAVTIPIGLLLLLLIGTFIHRSQYGNLSPWNPPERFNYCGYRYYRQSETSPGGGLTVTKAQALSAAGANQLNFTFNVGDIHKWPVYTTPGFVCSAQRSASQESIFQTVYLQTAPDQYLVMTDAF